MGHGLGSSLNFRACHIDPLPVAMTLLIGRQPAVKTHKKTGWCTPQGCDLDVITDCGFVHSVMSVVAGWVSDLADRRVRSGHGWPRRTDRTRVSCENTNGASCCWAYLRWLRRASRQGAPARRPVLADRYALNHRLGGRQRQQRRWERLLLWRRHGGALCLTLHGRPVRDCQSLGAPHRPSMSALAHAASSRPAWPASGQRSGA